MLQTKADLEKLPSSVASSLLIRHVLHRVYLTLEWIPSSPLCIMTALSFNDKASKNHLNIPWIYHHSIQA